MRLFSRTTISRFTLAAALALAVSSFGRSAHAQGTWTQVDGDRRLRERVRLVAPHRRACARPRLRGLNTWQILTPDKAGNYATGTWKAVANSAHARGGAQQHVLKDGRFFVGGGEYIDGPACTPALCNTAEI